jgi:hypothetical protein
LHKGGTVTNALRMGKEGGAIMMKEYISLVGFILTIFIVGIAVGKLVEKIERFLCRKEAEEHNNTNKNDRH